jgi:hypothetical protein
MAEPDPAPEPPREAPTPALRAPETQPVRITEGLAPQEVEEVRTTPPPIPAEPPEAEHVLTRETVVVERESVIERAEPVIETRIIEDASPAPSRPPHEQSTPADVRAPVLQPSKPAVVAPPTVEERPQLQIGRVEVEVIQQKPDAGRDQAQPVVARQRPPRSKAMGGAPRPHLGFGLGQR